MTSPGDEVERVPLKVVPIFVTPIDVEPEVDEEVDDAEVVDEPTPRVRRPLLGWAAALLAAATIGVHIAAIVVASSGDFATGTVLSYVAIGLSALAVVAGISGAIVGPRRAWGIVAALVAALANPVVLLWLLRQLSELQT